MGLGGYYNRYRRLQQLMLFLHTSVVLRYLTGEPAETAARDGDVMSAAAAGRLRLFLPDVLLVEIDYVLHRVLRLDRKETAGLLRSRAYMPGLVLERRGVADHTSHTCALRVPVDEPG